MAPKNKAPAKGPSVVELMKAASKLIDARSGSTPAPKAAPPAPDPLSVTPTPATMRFNKKTTPPEAAKKVELEEAVENKRKNDSAAKPSKKVKKHHVDGDNTPPPFEVTWENFNKVREYYQLSHADATSALLAVLGPTDAGKEVWNQYPVPEDLEELRAASAEFNRRHVEKAKRAAEHPPVGEKKPKVIKSKGSNVAARKAELGKKNGNSTNDPDVLAESLGELPQGTLLDDEALSDAGFSQTGSGSDQPPHPLPDAGKAAVREEEEYVEPEPVEDQEEAGRQVLNEEAIVLCAAKQVPAADEKVEQRETGMEIQYLSRNLRFGL